MAWFRDIAWAALTAALVYAAAGFLFLVIVLFGCLSHSPWVQSLPAEKVMLGIFPLWFAVCIVSGRLTRFASRLDNWKVSTSGCPPWMRGAFYVVLAVAALCFVRFQFLPQDTDIYPSDCIAGIGMVFYAISFLTLYSALRSPDLLYGDGQRCPFGHPVTEADLSCPQCGAEIMASEKYVPFSRFR